MFERLTPRLFAAEDETGGGEAPVADPVVTDDPAVAPSDPAAGDAPASNWWESDTFSAETQQRLKAKGMTGLTLEEAFARQDQMYLQAEKRLGASPDKLIQLPKDGAVGADWISENREKLGLPTEIGGYDIGELSLPEGMARDADLEGQMKQIAFEEGLTPTAMKRMADAYASHMGALWSGAGDELATANQAMEAELRSEWGQAYSAKVESAKQALSAVASEAGMDEQATFAIMQSLKEKGGDASVMRMFAAIGTMMGEDSLAQGKTGGFSTTPAEARAELARLRADDGEYGQAVKAGDSRTVSRLQPRIEQLTKIAGS